MTGDMGPDAIGDLSRLHPDGRKAVDENLMPGEVIRVVIHGIHASAMIGTDRRAFVFKKGWLSGAGLGQKMTTWDYRNIVGLQIETGWISGVVVIQAPGVAAVDTSYWAAGKDAPINAPNAIGVSGDLDAARTGANELRRLIAERQASVAAPTVEASADKEDVIGLLRQLGALRDAGIVTPEEFDAKKQDLLARL